ncbi:hypothetical protein FRC04_005818 [Tulasnella sp. 424]|nr:hypothetical protein FRC04_005818 [Tulasnella sp. 424]KAG8962730.1 hypothetical protein FRC05_005132 [Tulasnella sp. 425]
MPPAHPQKPVVGFEDDAPATFQNGLRPHVMRIPELVELIISLGELNRKDLVSLALLCRATRGPALDALWKTVADLRFLWKLLDPSAVTFSKDHLEITRPLTPFDWGRWYYYSHRIKYVTNAVIPSIDEVSFANLTASVGQVTVGEPLLPNLRGSTATLWTNSPSNCLVQEFLLRGSYVREVGITLHPHPVRFSEMGHVYDDGDVGDVFIPTFDTLRKDTLSSLSISLFTRHNYSPSISPYILTFRNIT